MSSVQHLEVEPGEAGQRLDRWLRAKFPDLTQGRIEKMLRKGEVRVDGGPREIQHADRGASDGACAAFSEAAAPDYEPKVSAADTAFLRDLILYEDDHMIALNKPPGISVQGGTGQTRHIDGMLDALSNGRERPTAGASHRQGHVRPAGLGPHRRSGARADRAFRSKAARKIYWAAVVGVPKVRAGTITYALQKQPGGMGEKMACIDPRELKDHPDAKRAVTDYAVVETVAKRASWLILRPVDGPHAPAACASVRDKLPDHRRR